MPPHRINPHCSDAELIAAHLTGNLDAWEVLLERYENFLFHLLLRAGLNRTDAEDIFQNVCLKLYLHLEDLRDMTKLSGWLAAVARQEVFRLRRRRTEISIDTTDLPEMAADRMLPEEVVLAEEHMRLVQQGLQELALPCRSLLTLLYRPSPATYAEVSAQLGLPTGSIGPQRARCLDRLKKILQRLGF